MWDFHVFVLSFWYNIIHTSYYDWLEDIMAKWMWINNDDPSLLYYIQSQILQKIMVIPQFTWYKPK